jgi:hypothetical protein
LAAVLRLPPTTSRRAGQQRTPPGPASTATRQDTGQNTALHLARCQDPIHNVGQNGHWKDDCPSLSLQSRSVSHSHSQQRPLGPGGRRLTWPWDLGPLQDHLRGSQGNHPSSRQASITYLVLPDFSGKLYPSQIFMVGGGMFSSTSQKGKTFI